MSLFKKISIMLGALLLVTTGCKDEDLAPILTFDQMKKGAYPRLIEESDKLINLLDVENSKYTYTVEFVDLEKGRLVSEYVLDLTYEDNNPDNGDDSAVVPGFRSFSQSDFKDNEGGYRQVSTTITSSELITAAGTTADQLQAGDNFIVTGRVIMQDGAVHTDANSAPSITNASFRGHFDYTLPCACPSGLAGTYDFDGSDFWCGEPDASGQVTIQALGGGVYTFDDWSLGAYPACYGGLASGWGSLTFTDVCNSVSFTGFTDNYGDTWTFKTEVDGNNWTIEWENTYGEAGKAVIKNPNGWPFTIK